MLCTGAHIRGGPGFGFIIIDMALLHGGVRPHNCHVSDECTDNFIYGSPVSYPELGVLGIKLQIKNEGGWLAHDEVVYSRR